MWETELKEQKKRWIPCRGEGEVTESSLSPTYLAQPTRLQSFADDLGDAVIVYT